MKKTLLLCFIHGFKGDDDTFAGFPQHLQAILSHALPSISIAAVVYPTYETRGDLRECVARVKEWLTNKVIDLEIANGATSPTVDPSVHTVLVGHSMGGIVAAEVALSITSEKPIVRGGAPAEPSLTFPFVKGVLAFDTPYLGISPGVVAHSAEGQWTMGKSAYEAYQSAASMFGTKGAATTAPLDPSKGLPSAATSTTMGAASPSSWSRWGTYAVVAGAASALAAGGAAVYSRREDITQGWTWVGSHLEFVGCLARGEEMKQRLAAVSRLEQELGFGFANLYTCLGRAVSKKDTLSSQTFGEDRTFCNLPKSELKRYFHKAVNDAASLEVMAHMYMFAPKSNPGYYAMSEHARELIAGWVDEHWYAAASVEDSRGAALENAWGEDPD